MPDEGFLRRWSRLKATGGEAAEALARPAPAAPAAAAPIAPAAPAPTHAGTAAGTAPAMEAPTLEDAARLTPDSDFSAFVGQGVDKSVQRLALKKLFADPHFHVMDGLDMYMDDYNKPSPMSAAMFAALEHAKSALRPSEPHRPQLAANAADGAAAPAPTPEPAGADPAAGARPAQDRDEPLAVAAGDESAGAESFSDESFSDEFFSDQPARDGGAQRPVHEQVHDTDAPPACAQPGTHQQSLQGQA